MATRSERLVGRVLFLGVVIAVFAYNVVEGFIHRNEV